MYKCYKLGICEERETEEIIQCNRCRLVRLKISKDEMDWVKFSLYVGKLFIGPFSFSRHFTKVL